MRALIIMVLALLLAGCASRPIAVAVCPETKAYSQAFLDATAAELPQAGPHVQAMVRDYGDERGRLRACKPPPEH